MTNRKKHKGSIVGLMLIISIIITILGMSMLAIGNRVRVRAIRATEQTAARVAADAGLTVGIQTLMSQYEDGTLDDDNLPVETDVALPHSNGFYSYTVTKNGSEYSVSSEGDCNGSTKSVTSVIGMEGMTYDYAILTEGDMIFRNSSKVDWFNNKPGSNPLKVGTNSTSSGDLTLLASAFINGDLVVGADGTPGVVIKNLGGSYTGSTYAQTENISMPSVCVPSYLSGDSSGGKLNKSETLDSSDSGKYDNIDLGKNEKLLIEGDVELYLTGRLTLGNGAEIEVAEDASLIIYVDGKVEGKNGCEIINETDDATKFKLMCTDECGDVVLKNSGEMYGIIYAPNADVNIHNSATYWGAIIGKTCDMDNGSILYYDASLQEYNDPELFSMKVKSWSE